VVFGLYLIGIAVAVLTGLVMKHTLLRGETTPFVMELPPYHLPTLRGVLIRTWERTRGFVFRAGAIIVPMVLVLNFLNALGTDGSFGNADTDRSVLSGIGRGIAPAFSPMGLDEENWPAAVGIFTGVLAKEAVVGTLDNIYSGLAAADAAAGTLAAGGADAAPAFALGPALTDALATIPANLRDALGTWGDPLGVGIGDVSDPAAAAEAQAVEAGVFGAMAARFDGAAGAFAYLLFILLYFPCTAALAAVYRETNLGWMLFVAGWTTGLAYTLSTLFYQTAIFARQPTVSAAWIGAMLALLAAAVITLRWWGLREKQRLYRPAAEGAEA
jgi:ferrous iron transport protein B